MWIGRHGKGILFVPILVALSGILSAWDFSSPGIVCGPSAYIAFIILFEAVFFLLAWAVSATGAAPVRSLAIAASPFTAALLLPLHHLLPSDLSVAGFSPVNPLGLGKYIIAGAGASGFALFAALWIREIHRGEMARPGRAVALVVIVISLFSGAYDSLMAPRESDEGSYVLLGTALAMDLSPMIGSPEVASAYRDIYLDITPPGFDWRLDTAERAPYSYRMPGLPLLIAPIIRLSSSLELAGPPAWFLMMIPGIIAAGLLAGAAGGIAESLLAPRGTVVIVSAVTGLSLPVVHYATTIQPEIFIALSSALALLYLANDDSSPLAAGLFSFLPPLFHERGIVVSVVLVVFGLIRKRGRTRFLLGLLLPLLIFAVSYAYTRQFSTLAPGHAFSRLGIAAPLFFLGTLVLLFLDPARGLFVWAPGLLPAIAGPRRWNPLSAPAISAVGLYLALMALYPEGRDSFPFCKYGIVLFGLLPPLLTPGWEGLMKGRARFMGFAILGANAAAFILGISVPQVWRLLI